MAQKVVNLDALIPRADFFVGDSEKSAFDSTKEVQISMLRDEFFGPSLRKPDYQRETAAWTPAKVADLIKSFVDGDLVPAVILWKGGNYNFVVDGAHRLSALLAYIYDDYGDGDRSRDKFKGVIPPEQIKIAKEARTLVNSSVGSYDDLRKQGVARDNAPTDVQRRILAIGQRSIPTQWVPTNDAKVAEASFFKINQAAVALDATEKIILRMRRTASSIAARAIARAGTGHAYWSHFDEPHCSQTPVLGKDIHELLFKPELVSGAICQGEFPIGGVGYNVLQLAFELVNRINGVGNLRANISESRIKEMEDSDGELTIQYLESVKRRLLRMTGTSPKSLGLNPLVYVYSASGEYISSSFFAMLDISRDMTKGDEARRFRDCRANFEDYLVRRKSHISSIIHTIGGRRKSDQEVEKYMRRIIDIIQSGGDPDEELVKDDNFKYLFYTAKTSGAGVGQGFSRSVKNSVVVEDLLENRRPCKICGGALQSNSQHVDHIHRRRDGGSNTADNGRVTHPICNSLRG